MAACALGPRGLSLELGGKSPLIVFEDADVPSAVDWILTGILWGSGQVCSATSRVLLHSSIRAQVLYWDAQDQDTVFFLNAICVADVAILSSLVLWLNNRHRCCCVP